MATSGLVLIFFFYGLTFFSMGLIVATQSRRGSDTRLHHALQPLIGFGLIHGTHEWIELFETLGVLPGQQIAPLVWKGIRIAILAFSFFSLTAFGASLLSPNEKTRRLSLLIPLIQSAIWGYGLLTLAGRYDLYGNLWDVADAWTRYVVAIPGAMMACWGLITQQRAFRLAGMERFSRDSLWAAVAIAWYGLVGQSFPHSSPLPPSTFLNQEKFLEMFGFPVQLLRAGAAIAVAVFVVRFLRSFEVETDRKIAELQVVRLQEAQRKEALRGELLRRVVAAQEAERQRIARELHDETGQALTAIGLGLRGITSTFLQDEEKAVDNLRKLEDMATRSLDELRRLISDLRPSHLDDLGLPAAIRWYIGELSERTDFTIDLDIAIDDGFNLPATTKTALFRVVQEALTNIVKHAKASNVWVRLSSERGNVQLEIEDNGIGFDPQKYHSPGQSAWGLLGMEERATLLNGKFSLHSWPGGGTHIRVEIPCQAHQALEERKDDSTAIGG